LAFTVRTAQTVLNVPLFNPPPPSNALVTAPP
jgi:hypothetical protein